MRAVGLAAAMAVVAIGVVAPATGPAEAAPSSVMVTAGDWNPGNIISDPLFYDSMAMSEAEIQTFLNGKIGACGNSLCLRNLRVWVDSRAASYSPGTGALICNAFEGGTLTAAAIIYRAQVACSISAKVLLATLQKEQGLVTKTAPTQSAVDRAMGMACPDTAPCAEYALGFGNQVYLGAKQLMTYRAARFAKQPGLQYIQYHPSTACGGTNVYVQNYATAALYSYTPYQPDPPALANIGGTGGGCSSYGNRNFWVYYNSWFGSTQGYPAASTDRGPSVMARDAAGALWLYPGDARGSWGVPRQLIPGLAGMRYVFGAGDLDGDGHRDVIAVDGSGVMWLYPLDASGTVAPRVRISDGWGSMTAVFSAGDFTGDGVPDVFARGAGGELFLFAGTGTGGFRPRVQVGNGWGGIDALTALGDFSGDGLPDVMGRDAAGNLLLFPGNGRGGWSGVSRIIGVGWAGFPRLLSPGDFDNDGRVDVIASTSAGLVYLYRGDGRGGWLGGGPIGNGWGGFDLMVGPGPSAGRPFVEQGGSGDVNRDGARDVLAVASDGNLYAYFGNGYGGWIGSRQVGTGWGDKSATFGVGDFDGDGAADVMSRDNDGTLWVHPTAPDGSVGAGKRIGNGWNTLDLVFGAGDYNGDSTNDLIAREPSGALWLYPTDGAGGWLPRKQVGYGWAGFTSVFSVGDFDGTGTPDLITRDTAGNLYLYPGDGGGSWLAPVQIGNGWAGFTALFSPGDFTGDGAPDIIARSADGTLWLYPGNGRGGWGAGTGRAIGWGWGGLSWIG